VTKPLGSGQRAQGTGAPMSGRTAAGRTGKRSPAPGWRGQPGIRGSSVSGRTGCRWRIGVLCGGVPRPGVAVRAARLPGGAGRRQPPAEHRPTDAAANKERRPIRSPSRSATTRADHAETSPVRGFQGTAHQRTDETPDESLLSQLVQAQVFTCLVRVAVAFRIRYLLIRIRYLLRRRKVRWHRLSPEALPGGAHARPRVQPREGTRRDHRVASPGQHALVRVSRDHSATERERRRRCSRP
jgi:hypothetical protein